MNKRIDIVGGPPVPHCAYRLSSYLPDTVHAVTEVLVGGHPCVTRPLPTHGEDLAHILRVVGKGPEVVDGQDAIEDQTIIADVCVQSQHLDQL